MAVNWNKFITVSDEDTVNIICGKEVLYLSTGGGSDGRGIVSITKTGTSGLVDTYTILYTDGTTSTFDVTNGTGAWGQITGNIANQTDLQEVLDGLSDGLSAVTDDIAAEFSASEIYYIGDYVIKDNVLYKFVAYHYGAWDISKVTEVRITDELGEGGGSSSAKIIEDDVIPYSQKQILQAITVSGNSYYNSYQYHKEIYPNYFEIQEEGDFVLHYPVFRIMRTTKYDFIPLDKFKVFFESGTNRLTNVSKNEDSKWNYFTLTENSDKSFSIGLNGDTVPSNNFNGALSYHLILDKGSYKLTGGVKSGTNTTYIQMRVNKLDQMNQSTVIATDTGDGANFSLSEETYVEIIVDLVNLSSSNWCWDTPIKPMLTESTISHSNYIAPEGRFAEIDLTSIYPDGFYGGEYDLRTGNFTNRYGYIESYGGETLPGYWYSSNFDDTYKPGSMPSIGATVVYELPDLVKVQGHMVLHASLLVNPGDYICFVDTSPIGETRKFELQWRRTYENNVTGYTYSKFDADRRFIQQKYIAEEYDPEGTYNLGDIVMKDNKLYRLTAEDPEMLENIRQVKKLVSESPGTAKAGDYITNNSNLYNFISTDRGIIFWSLSSEYDAFSFLAAYTDRFEIPELSTSVNAKIGDYIIYNNNVYIFTKDMEVYSPTPENLFTYLIGKNALELCTVTGVTSSGSLTENNKNLLSIVLTYFGQDPKTYYMVSTLSQKNLDYAWDFISESAGYTALSPYLVQYTDPVPNYDPEQIYSKGDIFSYEGEYYYCIVSGHYWEFVQTTVEAAAAEKISESESKLQKNIDKKVDPSLLADAYDPTATYSAGDVVTKDGQLIRIIATGFSMLEVLEIKATSEETGSVMNGTYLSYDGNLYIFTWSDTTHHYYWNEASAQDAFEKLDYLGYLVPVNTEAYDPTETYSNGDVIIYNGKYFVYDESQNIVFESVTIIQLINEIRALLNSSQGQ